MFLAWEATMATWIMVYLTAFWGNGGSVPGWVIALIVATSFAWSSFGFVPLYTHIINHPNPEKYKNGEFAYVLLSLISKMILGWVFLGGSMRQTSQINH